MGREVHSRYLGPSWAIGCLMTSKLFNEKGYVLHRSSFHSLTKDEFDDPKAKERRTTFDQRVGTALGPGMTLEDATPEYDLYDDGENNQITTIY
jgi:hypothetical protein